MRAAKQGPDQHGIEPIVDQADHVQSAYVRHSNGGYYVQHRDDNQHGFALSDDESSYPGGLGLGNGSWVIVRPEDVPIEEIERLGELADYAD